MPQETVSAIPSPRSSVGVSRVQWLVVGATLLACAAVVARLPLWGTTAWGIHEVPNLAGNLPLLVVMGLLFGAYIFWERSAQSAETGKRTSHAGKIAVFCALALGLGLGARLGESAGWGRLAILTINPASGGFFEAAYDSQHDPNWLQNYPKLMKEYHHVHSHPPMGVALMRWWLGQRSPALTGATDNFLAISPGTNSTALAQFTAGAWKRPYTANDIAAAFWGGMMWLLCALLVPACSYVSANALFGSRAALQSASLACVVPSLLMFVPGADQSYVSCAALALALAITGYKRFEATPAIGATLLALGGIAAALGVTGSFAGAWAILLTSTFLALRGGSPFKTRVTQVVIYMGAGLLTLVVLRFMGMDWLTFWRSLIAYNVDANVNPILRFVYHLADFFTFFGVPISIILFWGMFRSWRSGRQSLAEESDETQVASRNILALALPTLTVLLLLNIVISMAETARIWMLFMPPLLVAVGGILSRSQAPALPRWVLAAQLIQTWVFVVFLNVWSL
ncbi:hypothetical protein IAD21_05160 [Abditibacteriota bacterium]|nr:hypothetical protein IAD21_05160 [Abditibacteriota bacterium]